MSDFDFTGLDVWKLSHQLMIETYTFLKFLPKSEMYNHVDQLKRSISSISANIAEGHGRYYYLENISFCRKARRSLSESKNHFLAIKDLQLAPIKECNLLIDKCDTIRKILNGYIRFLKNKKIGQDELE